MDRADLRVALLAQVVAGGFDVLGSAAEGDEDGLGVGGAVAIDEPVASSGEPRKVTEGVLEKAGDGFVPVVAAGRDAVHVVLLILDGA